MRRVRDGQGDVGRAVRSATTASPTPQRSGRRRQSGLAPLVGAAGHRVLQRADGGPIRKHQAQLALVGDQA